MTDRVLTYFTGARNGYVVELDGEEIHFTTNLDDHKIFTIRVRETLRAAGTLDLLELVRYHERQAAECYRKIGGAR